MIFSGQGVRVLEHLANTEAYPVEGYCMQVTGSAVSDAEAEVVRILYRIR